MTKDKKPDNIKVTLSGLELFAFFGIVATKYKPKDKPTFNSKFTFDRSSKKDMAQMAILKKSIVLACAQEWGNNHQRIMKDPEFAHGLRDPRTCKHLRDKVTGEPKPTVKQLEGKMFFGAKANEDRRPCYGVIKGGRLIEVESDKDIAKYFYSGAIVQLSVSIFCYETPNLGYSFWMDGLVLESKGKKTYGRPELSQSFDLKKLLTEVVDVDEEGGEVEETASEPNGEIVDDDPFGFDEDVKESYNNVIENEVKGMTDDSFFNDDIAF